MEEQRDEADRPESGSNRPTDEGNDWGRQILGAIIGGGVVFVLGTIAQRLGWIDQSLTRYVLWGSVVGALFGSYQSLERAGRRLTRRDNRWLNIVVALLGMAVAFALIYVISRAMAGVMQQFN